MARKILLIDDDALFRSSLSFHLQQAGYQVQAAASAEDGLAIIRNNPPDLVLLDISLPGMDGLDALHYINDNTEIPVIFVTAHHRELDEILGLELGAERHFMHHVPMFEIGNEIDFVLSEVKRLRQRYQNIQVAPIFYQVDDNLLYLIRET